MADATISTIQLDLNSYKVYDSATMADMSRTAKANIYTVSGVTNSDGTLRQLSMAELVMVICLSRAAEKEKAVIKLRKTMSDNTSTLESLTEIESKLLDGASVASILSPECSISAAIGSWTPITSWSMRWAIARCPIPRRRLK